MGSSDMSHSSDIARQTQKIWAAQISTSFGRYSVFTQINNGYSIGPEPEAVERVEPFKGWRMWYYDIQNDWVWEYFSWLPWVKPKVVLTSPTYRTQWEGPLLKADARPDWVPVGHGIYAWSDIGSRSRPLYNEVIGEVELFGKVIEHEKGYRGENVRITKLYVDRHQTDERIIKALEERYQCDVKGEAYYE